MAGVRYLVTKDAVLTYSLGIITGRAEVSALEAKLQDVLERLERETQRVEALRHQSQAVKVKTNRFAFKLAGKEASAQIIADRAVEDNLLFNSTLASLVTAARSLVAVHSPVEPTSSTSPGSAPLLVSQAEEALRLYEAAEQAFAHTLAGFVKRQFHEGGFLGLAAEESPDPYKIHHVGSLFSGSRSRPGDVKPGRRQRCDLELLRLHRADALALERQLEVEVGLKQSEAALQAAKHSLGRLKRDPSAFNSKGDLE